jgi:hypothetical protein
MLLKHLTFEKCMWLPKTYIIWYDLASNVGGMNMCNMFLSMSSSSLIVEVMAIFIQMPKRVNSLKWFGNIEHYYKNGV